MTPEKEVEFPGVFIENHSSWLVTLEFPQLTRVRFPLGQGKSGNLSEDQEKVRGENFYPCKFLTSIKKSYAQLYNCMN